MAREPLYYYKDTIQGTNNMADRDLAIVLRHLRQSLSGDSGWSDAELLERFTSVQDNNAFKMLVRRHERLVFGVCRRILRDFHDAEDAFQATFVALARKAGSISRRQAVSCWLYKVAFRLAVALRAKRAKETTREGPLTAAEGLAAPPSVHQSVEWREVRAILDEEVNRLPERFRAPIILCYLEGKTVDEAALQLGCPRGTVASRLARARERLRVRLTRRGLAISGAALTAGLTQAWVATAAPFSLACSAVKLAKVCGAANGTAGAVIPARIVALTEEVLHAMTIKKLITVVAVLIVSAGGLLVGGLGMHVLYLSAAAEPGPVAFPGERPKAQVPPAQKTPPAKEQPDAAKPTVSKPVQRDFTPYEVFTGELSPSRSVNVQARVGGRLASVHCQTGATVKKEELLFQIDSAAFKEALQRARLNLEIAEARLKQSETHLRRIKEAARAVTIEEVDKAKSAFELDAAAAKLAVLDVERAQRELDATEVKAPADGRVGDLLVNVGSAVSADKTLLTTVALLDPMRVTFNMDEGNYLRYQRLLRDKQVSGPGSALSFALLDEEGFPHKGTLAAFGDRFERPRGTIDIQATVPNPDGQLLPGMFASVHLPFGKPRQVLQVPEAALTNKYVDKNGTVGYSGNYFVIVINNDNLVEHRFVKLGQEDGAMRVIEEGLRPDDWVVVEGFEGLHPGDRVEPRRR